MRRGPRLALPDEPGLHGPAPRPIASTLTGVLGMSAQPTATGPNLGMQVTTFENPLGINGFEFVEFAAPQGQGELLHDYFRKMGFSAVLHHKTRALTVYRQGGVNFLVNEDPDS